MNPQSEESSDQFSGRLGLSSPRLVLRLELVTSGVSLGWSEQMEAALS